MGVGGGCRGRGAGYAVFRARGLVFRVFLPSTDGVGCTEEVGGTGTMARVWDLKWEEGAGGGVPGTRFSVLVALFFVCFCRQRMAWGVGKRMVAGGRYAAAGV